MKIDIIADGTKPYFFHSPRTVDMWSESQYSIQETKSIFHPYKFEMTHELSDDSNLLYSKLRYWSDTNPHVYRKTHRSTSFAKY